MATVILKSTDKNFIFEFSFSQTQPVDSPPVEYTPDELTVEAASNKETTIIGTTPLTYLEVVAYRQDYPDLRFNWADFMKENQSVPINIPSLIPISMITPTTDKKAAITKKMDLPDMEEDGNWCKGSFHIYQNSQTFDRFVWFDLNFGEGYEAVYEGCMVQFPTELF